ncbi:cation-transporting atpase 4 [Apiospora phragmitis]|uniref:Cation-transporting atpase 4 n=1 Tax=Apiospora phragmitis TaxID=2905665 RepID=A0ABR1TTL7_9PEZI
MDTYYGMGAKDSQVKPEEIALRKYMVYFEIPYFASSSATKLAMTFMIMRLGTEKKYLWTFWGSIAAMLLTFTIILGIFFGNCVPFAATWNPGLGHCKREDG